MTVMMNVERQFNHSLHPIAPTSMDDANCGTYYPIQHNKYYVIFPRYTIENVGNPFLFLFLIHYFNMLYHQSNFIYKHFNIQAQQNHVYQNHVYQNRV